MSESEHPSPVVFILIAEPFFLEKVEGTLCALAKDPRRIGWEVAPAPGGSEEAPEDAPGEEQAPAGTAPDLGSLVKELAAAEPVAMVVDLENDKMPVLEILRAVRAEKSLVDLPILGYCSHVRTDLHEAAEGIPVQVVPRSTFAANLVRLLMELSGPPEPAQGDDAGT